MLLLLFRQMASDFGDTYLGKCKVLLDKIDYFNKQ